MAQTFLVFDFGTDEDTAQQARHTIDRWKQGFRLDKKMLAKFDRGEPEQANDAAQNKEKQKSEPANGGVHMIVKLDFSDHEKLSHQRWVDRIPAEAPFKDAKPQVVRQGDAEFESTAERFDNLD